MSNHHRCPPRTLSQTFPRHPAETAPPEPPRTLPPRSHNRSHNPRKRLPPHLPQTAEYRGNLPPRSHLRLPPGTPTCDSDERTDGRTNGEPQAPRRSPRLTSRAGAQADSDPDSTPTTHRKDH